MDNDGKNNARKRGQGYLGDDHCPEHGHGCQEHWCGNGMRPLSSKEVAEGWECPNCRCGTVEETSDEFVCRGECGEVWQKGPLPSKEVAEEREYLDAVMNGEEDWA